MDDPRRAARAVALGRMIVGTAVIGILLYTYAIGIPARGANPFDYFGYFTNLTSLLTGALLVVVGARALDGSKIPTGMHTARGIAVACMIVVSVVYNVVVPGTGSAPMWVSVALHLVFPALLALDWAIVSDRPPLPWRRIWLVLPYPLVWLLVTVIRGATDGWVPYGFLLPERGAVQLVTTACALLATLLVAAALTWTLSRLPARR